MARDHRLLLESLGAAPVANIPGFNEQFTINGRAPQTGEMWKNPNLADTLQKIADGGRDAFYKGDIAAHHRRLLQGQRRLPVAMKTWPRTRANGCEPVCTNYRGYDVWELPPNGQGIAALQMLNMLEGYDFCKIAFGSAEHLHLFVEAKKLAFADRARWYADPAFQQAAGGPADFQALRRRARKLISPDKPLREVQPGTPAELDEGDTIYLTTADANGMMVSLIQSNYRGMGSGMAPPGLGFILQDRGEMFVLKPGHPNTFAPGKRPFQTIIPAFITKDGKPWISFGLMGGAMQPQGHVQIVMNLVDFGMNLQEAGDAPRIQHDGRHRADRPEHAR